MRMSRDESVEKCDVAYFGIGYTHEGWCALMRIVDVHVGRRNS